MKLTIIQLQAFSEQDRRDLAKIWPTKRPDETEAGLNDHQQIFAAKFNDRLLAAVVVRLQGNGAELRDFMVRDVTRRRGVGSYLLAETLHRHPAVTEWWISARDYAEPDIFAAFMQAAGFTAQPEGRFCLRR